MQPLRVLRTYLAENFAARKLFGVYGAPFASPPKVLEDRLMIALHPQPSDPYNTEKPRQIK
jgi:hypothetical protein